MTARISLVIAALLIAGPVAAQSTPTQVHTPPQVDPGVYSGRLKVDYPTPYDPATEDAIRKTLELVHAYVDQSAPVRVIDGDTGAPVNDLTRLPAKVALARTDLQILTYEWGVTYAGMLRAAQVTSDRRYGHYTDERLSALAVLAAHAKKNLPPDTTRSNFPPSAHGLSMRSILMPRALDDAGAMCAAFIKAELAGLGDKKLRPWIDNYVQYVSSGQFRLEDGTLARKVYGRKQVLERHRHRYEFNNAYREQLEAKGLVCSGASPDESLVEMIELRDHPWFVATQAHPEFKSRPMDCHPLFKGFIKAALAHSAQRRQPAKSKLKVVKG